MNKIFNFLPLLLSFLIVILTLALFHFLPPKLPLFYSLPWGEKQLVSKEQLLIIPGSITLVTLGNLIFSWHLHTSQQLFKKILYFSSLLISILMTITFFKIILIYI